MKEHELREYAVEQGLTLATSPINQYIVREFADPPHTLELALPLPLVPAPLKPPDVFSPAPPNLHIVYRLCRTWGTLGVYEYAGWSLKE